MKTNFDSKQTIVGFNVGHNGSCTIIRGNEMISIPEERLNRKKYSDGYMYSFLYCLNELGIKIEDIDLFVSSSYGDYLPDHFMGDFEALGINKEKFLTVDHHLSHAYSSFYLSPFDNALVVVIDGQGNLNMTESYYIASDLSMERIGGNNPARSKYQGVGRTYEAFTNYCGWSAQEAGKTMGLAPYGQDRFPSIQLYDINDELQICSRVNGKYLDAAVNFCKENGVDFGQPGQGFDNKDAAYFVQDRTERIIIELIQRLYEKYKINNLCLAGGVFLNSVVNRKILEKTEIKNVFIPPFCDDTGESVGNALFGYYNYFHNTQRFNLKNAYLGREYTDEEILDVLEKKQKMYILPYAIKGCNFKYRKSGNIARDTAKLLAQGKIIGWFQGGSEIGPRALGHRSILCAPAPKVMKDILNERVKHREMFRPFAPVVLEEELQSFFDFNVPSPFMLNVAVVKEDKRDSIAATVHIDNTGRLQTVNQTDNGTFYELVKEYNKITGVPVILNTSFNDAGEPIVETPKDAMLMFCKQPIDYLIINDFIIEKE